MAKRQLQIKDFKYGIIDSEEEQSIPRGAATRSLNFLTRGSKIELRRGFTLLGETEQGTGRITGLGVAKKPNGDDILYRTRKRKIEYLDTSLSSPDWVEVGTNTLPSAVVATDTLGEDISIEAYSNPTGKQVWFNSPNSGPFKIMTANPASITSMYVAGTNYKGYMRIKGGRMYVWKRYGNPPNTTDLFASQLDVQASSAYTQVTSESIAASGTLAFKAGGPRRICFEVVATVGSETFTDNGDGTLAGSLGSSATIDYTTGAYTGLGVGTADYRWADDSAVKGIANFAISSTRVAGEGFVLAQALGADFQNMASLNGSEYCLHKKSVWVVTISGDDTDLTNLIFRSRTGIPNHRAMVETSDGIYYIDDSDEADPHFRLLVLQNQSSEVIPQSVSKQFKIADIKVGVNLSDYRFDKGACIEFGELVLFACRTKESSVNNRLFVYNKTNKAFDVMDYFVSCMAIYNGSLVAGDSLSDNVYVLFSGIDDDDAIISGYWESNLDNLGYNGLKRIVEITVEGDIGPEQSVKVLMSPDRGTFVEVRSPSDISNNQHAIEGDGIYVDSTQSVNVGAFTLGRGEIGGGGSGISAYHYKRTFRITLDKCEFIKFKVEPVGLGYFSLSLFEFSDVRLKWLRTINRYRVNR